MVMLVLTGFMSPQLFARLVRMIVRDLKRMKAGKLNMRSLEKLGSIGSSGDNPITCWRDLKTLLPVPKLPKLFRLKLPLVHTSMGRFFHDVPLLLPHQLFAALWKHYPESFNSLILGSRENCRKFWAAVKDSPQFRAHKVGTIPGYEDLFIPLKIHGDGAPVTGLGKGWGKLVDIFSVSSMLVNPGPSLMRNMMLFMRFQHLVCRAIDNNTMDMVFHGLQGDMVFTMFIWSFKACWEGRYPRIDWNDGNELDYDDAGTELCGGYFFCVWSLICDLEHAWKVYDMLSPTSNACCALCPVGRQLGCKWFDFRPAAEWLNHIYDETKWTAQGHPCLYHWKSSHQCL